MYLPPCKKFNLFIQFINFFSAFCFTEEKKSEICVSLHVCVHVHTFKPGVNEYYIILCNMVYPFENVKLRKFENLSECYRTCSVRWWQVFNMKLFYLKFSVSFEGILYDRLDDFRISPTRSQNAKTVGLQIIATCRS